MKNRENFIIILILAFVFIVALCLNWNFFGDLFNDTGREIVLPQLMREGNVLYKDIFSLYNPFSYQINAILYSVFGYDISVLKIAGAINSFLLLLCIYFITKEFTDKKYALLLCIFTILFFIFSINGCINFILPYSFAMIYALNGLLFAVLFGVLYLRKEKTYFSILSFLFLGFSFANKPEFCLCILPLFYMLYQKRADWKTYVLCIISFVLPILLSWGILFLQGFNIIDFKLYLDFIAHLFSTKEQIIFNSNIQNAININTITLILIDCLCFGALTLIPVYIVKLIRNKKSAIFGILLFLIFLPILYIIIGYMNVSCLFSFACILLAVILVKSIKDKNIELGFLSLCAILSCARVHFLLIGTGYAIYYCLLPVCVLFIYFVNHFALDKEIMKKVITTSLCIFSVFVFTFKSLLKYNTFHNIHSIQGKSDISSPQNKAMVFNQAVDWIINNTNQDDTILMLPEGVIINYLTQRPVNKKYYHLTPNHISALNEEKIIEGLEENKPDYLLLNNNHYKMYGNTYMCDSFGFRICDFIKSNYELLQKYKSLTPNQNTFYIEIYELKK